MAAEVPDRFGQTAVADRHQYIEMCDQRQGCDQRYGGPGHELPEHFARTCCPEHWPRMESRYSRQSYV